MKSNANVNKDEVHERVPGDGVGEYEIGSHEYAIGKRAAKKMLEFAARKRKEREKLEAEELLQRLNSEEDE